MEDRRLQIFVGLMVLGCAVLLAVLLLQFAGHEPVFRRSKVILVHFPEAPGVSPNTPVRKSGILIGRVSKVQLAEEIPEYADWGGVIVTLEIDSHRKIFTDEVCIIRRTLLGDAVLEFVRRRVNEVRPTSSPGPTNSGNGSAGLVEPAVFQAQVQRQEVQPGGPPLRGQVVADPLEIVATLQQDLASAAQGVRRASDEIAKFVNRINELISKEDGLPTLRKRLEEIANRTGQALESFDQLAKNINELVGDPELRGQIRQVAAEIGPTIQEAKATLAQVRETFDEVEKATASARDNLDNLRQFTQALGERGPTLTAKIEETLNNLNRLSNQLAEFSARLADRRTTLGKLTSDSELYDNLNDLVVQVDQLSRQLQPVVRDLRVFSDRIARSPELLGVRGALERSPGTKGVPTLAELDPEGYRAGLHSQIPAYRPR
ncbi:MAG: MlaD family protein [Thermoguttaceae bacterium]|nr:MlaD family protein [Thermoguttaceae bacterium]MDW8078246.1 MlaD family protein [Thermoguttaceae bacterium]